IAWVVTHIAVSDANSLAMLAYSVTSSPASLRAAARCASARAASIRVAISASLNCTAWKSSIALPNCRRSAQYLSDSSSALRAIPTPWAPIPSRPASSPSIAYTNPMPSSPSMWPRGTRRSVNAIPAVFDALRPILSSGFAALYPTESVGTMKVEIPFAPRRRSGSSVRTMIIMRSAVPEFVAHALAPLSTQSFPSFVACAASDAASERASGGGDFLEHHQVGDAVETHPVVLFRRAHAEEAELAELVDYVTREMAGAIPLGGERLDLLAGELARELGDLVADVSRGRHRIPRPIFCRAAPTRPSP